MNIMKTIFFKKIIKVSFSISAILSTANLTYSSSTGAPFSLGTLSSNPIIPVPTNIISFPYNPLPTFFQPSPEQKIANWIKPTLDNLDPSYIHEEMKKKYIQFDLMDPSGNWKDKKLKAIENKLLPETNKKDLCDFVDEVANHAEKNQYLHRVLKDAETKDLSSFFQKVNGNKDKVMPDVVIYAKVLDSLTATVRSDVNILDTMFNIWEENRINTSYVTMAKNPLFYVKYFSVRDPLKRFLDCHKTGVMNPKLANVLLPVNILEATFVDYLSGNHGNVKAGLTLAKYKPGGLENKLLGTGPTTFSPDGNAAQIHYPHPKKWNDLYCAWNLGFVSKYSYAPYLCAKLLIPSVNNYQAAPSEYIMNRAVALYATLIYTKDGKSDESWYDPNIMESFNTINAQSAENYESL